MLIVCALIFVYMMAWSVQWSTFQSKWATQYSWQVESGLVGEPQVDSESMVSKPLLSTGTMMNPDIWFRVLTDVPQLFRRLGISAADGIMIDDELIIITSQTSQIAWTWDRKVFTWSTISQLRLNVDEVVFFNDSAWLNQFVLAQITNNQQTWLFQIPFEVWRDNRSYVNKVIQQLTQK